MQKNLHNPKIVRTFASVGSEIIRKVRNSQKTPPRCPMMNIANTPATPATTEIADDLREALRKGAVRFTFFKKDGSIREAYGTRNIQVASATTGTSVSAPYGNKPNPNAYFDLEKGAWRSFIPENVVSIGA